MAARAAVHCGLRGSVMAAPRRRAAGWGRWLCTAAAPRPWRLFGAMCLLRPPRITQPLEKEEEEIAALMGQVEGGAGGLPTGKWLPRAWSGEHPAGLAAAGGDRPRGREELMAPRSQAGGTLGGVASRHEATLGAPRGICCPHRLSWVSVALRWPSSMSLMSLTEALAASREVLLKLREIPIVFHSVR